MREKFVKLPKPLLARTDLSPVAKLVYGYLVDRMNSDGIAWPGVRRIATDTGCTPATVHKAVEQLANTELLAVEPGKGRRTNRYLRAKNRTQGESVVCQKTNGVCQKTNATARSVSKTERNQTHKERPKNETQRARTPDPNHKALTEHFCAAWKAKNGRKYPHAGARDAKAVTAILKAVDGDLAEARSIVDRFLADGDQWIGKTGHKLSILPSQLAAYMGKQHGNAVRGRARVNAEPGKYAGRERKIGAAASG